MPCAIASSRKLTEFCRSVGWFEQSKPSSAHRRCLGISGALRERQMMIISPDAQLSYIETRTRAQLGNRLAGALSASSRIWGRSAGRRMHRMFTQRGSTLQRKNEFRFEDKSGARRSQVVPKARYEESIGNDPVSESPAPTGFAQAFRDGGGSAIGTVCFAIILCSFARVALSITAPDIELEYGFSSTQMGVLQLWGYIIALIPAGMLSDKLGGVKVMLVGCTGWSVATVLFPALGSLGQSLSPLVGLSLARILMGVSSSVVIPAAASSVAEFVTPHNRGLLTTIVLSCFSIGQILGMILTSLIMEYFGWRGVFIACGTLGIVFVCITTCVKLLEAEKPLAKDKTTLNSTSASQTATLDKDSSVFHSPTDPAQTSPRIKTIVQMLGLIQYHGVHGWVFFVILNWSPTLIRGYSESVLTTGILSSCPWISAALCSLLGGLLGKALIENLNWPRNSVRRLGVGISMMGPALGFTLMTRVHLNSVTLTAFLVLITGALAFANVSFHAYVQDVSPSRAGFILGITNTFGTAMGIVGNLVAGILLDLSGSMESMYYISVGLCIYVFVYWMCTMDGQKLHL